jgi:hypothetical protein
MTVIRVEMFGLRVRLEKSIKTIFIKGAMVETKKTSALKE